MIPLAFFSPSLKLFLHLLCHSKEKITFAIAVVGKFFSLAIGQHLALRASNSSCSGFSGFSSEMGLGSITLKVSTFYKQYDSSIN